MTLDLNSGVNDRADQLKQDIQPFLGNPLQSFGW